MRTDFMGRSVAPLSSLSASLAVMAALLLGIPGAAAAQSPSAAPDAPRALGDRVLTGDQVVEPGDEVQDIVVVGGDLRVRGRVAGDAVVVGGNLILESSGLVLGDALVTGGEIVNQGGRVRGEMRALDGNVAGAAAGAVAGRDIEAEVERRVERAVERAERHSVEHVDRSRRHQSSWFGPIRDGFAGLISTLALGLVLAGIGAALVFYGRPYLETVSDTLRSSTLRSAGVGLAAGFLVVPAFLVLVVALAVSIVGIPLLLVAVPLYPLAIAAAVALGTLAAAHAVGERTAEQQRGFERRWSSNSYTYLFTGLAMLLAPLVAANLIEMTGFLDFIGVLLKVVTFAVLWIVATTGFGAVILSRAGTRRTFVAPPPGREFESDPLFDDEPTRGPHV